jgi:CubicO group peptidase (beta-lactamase class C family)
MTQSSFEWEPSYQQWGIYRHDWLGNRSFRFEQPGVNAAASLHTTAKDYARFMLALLKGTGLRPATWQAMLTPQIRPDSVKSPNVAWGLGVGLETLPDQKTFWHWGDQGDSKCFMVGHPMRKEGLVYFTNSSNGLSITGELLTSVFGGEQPAVAWLDYPVYHPAAGKLLHAILEQGAAVALRAHLADRSAHPAQAIGERMTNTIGYYLLRMKKVDEAIAVFTQNTVDFPTSGNVWDSLAEAYMTKGDKAHAIEYYEKSFQLDPTNTNAADIIKKLKTP